MSEFLKSAFDYFGNSGKSRGTNELVGNNIEIGNQTFKVISTIAEGGFAIVFEAQDVKTHKTYALKRLISHDSDASEEIMHEINYLKKLSGHPNIIKLCTAASIGQQKQGHAGTEFLIVTELCTGGQVIQLMQRRNKAFPLAVTLQMFNQVSKAIEHMHSQNPPIIHRDLKVENLLISSRAVIKLCDFGSATTEPHFPDTSWSGMKRSEVQEEIEKHTTPMYRAPEMLDLYQNFPITQACDIWALGCVLYYFCFNKHPFEDSAKLAILNANYTIPTNVETNDRICGLIYQMLLIDPRQRLGIVEIVNEVKLQASIANVPLKPSIVFDRESLVHLPPLKPLPDSGDVPRSPPTRPLPPTNKVLPNTPVKSSNKLSSPQNHSSSNVTEINTVIPTKSHISTSNQNSNDGKKVFGLLKEGAGSFMKNIRDVSNKVIEQVSSSINKADLDLTYVTSRIIMMPTPAEAGIDLLTKDKADDVQTFLDFRHPNQYFVYNLGLKLTTTDKLKERFMNVGFDPLKPPPLNNLVMLCMHQLQWLLSDAKNIIVVQCVDGRVASGVNVLTLLCFCRLVDNSAAAAEIIKFRRGDCHFTPSQLRYADYVCRMIRSISDPTMGADLPHNYVVKITGIELQPVPIFNRAKTGLRPFVEIFSDYKLVYSSMTNYDDVAMFTYDHKMAHISIPNISTHGDINIVVYHTRSNLVAKGKISAIKVCETQIYSGYLSASCTEICLAKNLLDHCDSDDDKYPAGFTLKINCQVTNKEAISSNQIQTLSWHSKKFKKEILDRQSQDDRLVPFSSKQEMLACLESSGIKLPIKEPVVKQPVVADKPKYPVPNEDFFFTLDWSASENNNTREQSDPPESPVVDFLNHNETYNTSFEKHSHSEAVGDLLGDFGAAEPIESDNLTSRHATCTDVDGLADFFAGFPSQKERVKSSSNNDLLGSLGNNESKDTSNLLFFETNTTNEKSNSFLFDPFDRGVLNISSSTADLTSHHLADPMTNRQTAPLIKPSNSTNCLLNLNSPNQIRTSPSFNSNQAQQKTEMFDNLTGVHSKPPLKQDTAAKSKIGTKTFDKPENLPTKNRKDAFQDLLGDFKPDSRSGSANNGARSIKEIRKETMTRTTDPETLLVLDWVDGKEKNIRALLCSLPSILWSDVRWPGVNMSELVTVGQVKKAYKNAIRCVHPDKWNNSEHENLAKMIMMELNEAMSEFEAEKNACQ